MNLVSEQITVGLIATLCGAVLLLLLGTQILDWYWLVVLFVAGASISAFQTWRMLPSPYQVAQTVDRRLSLHDSLSTAYHFHEPSAAARADALVVELQQQEADRVAGTLDAAQAMPWRAPKSLYPMMAAMAVVAGLGVLRYGIHGSLDLSAPIVDPMTDFFHPAAQQAARNAKNKMPRRLGEDPLAIPVDRTEAQKEDLDPASESALSQVDIPDTTQGEDGSATARTKQTEVKAAGDEGDEMDSGEEGDREAGDGKPGDSETSKDGGGDDAAKGEPTKDAPRKGAGGDNDSLMNKMKDAMANLMSKLKIPPQAGESKQSASNQKSGQKDGESKDAGSGQKGEKGQGQPQGKGSPSDDPDAQGQQGEQQAQAGQGKNSDKGAEAGNPNEAKSGMGKQDGSKALQDAEQVAAMGKLSELFGKRAQNITGEVMVEVTSSKQQQLRTDYSKSEGAHRESGGEIHRDEVPEVFQHYVQQYFEQVRKGEQAKPAK